MRCPQELRESPAFVELTDRIAELRASTDHTVGALERMSDSTIWERRGVTDGRSE